MAFGDLDLALALAPLYFASGWQPTEGFSVINPSKQAEERKAERRARGLRRETEADPEKHRKTNAAWRDRNREALRKANAAYRKANREKRREYDAARRSKVGLDAKRET